MRALLTGLLACLPVWAPAYVHGQDIPDFLGETNPRPQLLILGVFHFRDAGLDDHKPQHQFDVLSEQRQNELRVVLDRLADFTPTRIAVERRPEFEDRLNADYRSYLGGEFELRANEIYQIGFRLAKRLGHNRRWAIDARGHDLIQDWDAWRAKIGEYGQEGLDAEWAQEFRRFALFEDVLIDRQPLLDTLSYLNSDERVRRSHGPYVVGNAKAGRGEDYLGPDSRTRWYNRNLRIFNNIQRIDVTAADRILVIIGAGHLPILHLSAKSSPEYRFISVGEVLSKR